MKGVVLEIGLIRILESGLLLTAAIAKKQGLVDRQSTKQDQQPFETILEPRNYY